MFEEMNRADSELGRFFCSCDPILSLSTTINAALIEIAVIVK
jgi:hypothetical protein